MIKSLALTSIVCALNMGGSFNIQPKEVQWDITQEVNKQNYSYLTYNNSQEVTGDQHIEFYNKNNYVYENSYIRIETTELTRFSFVIQVINDELYLNDLSTNTYIWSYYKVFTNNAELQNNYPRYEISNTFSDNKGTEYTWSYEAPEIIRETNYTATQETKNAVNSIKNENNGENFETEINTYLTELNNITNTNYNEDATIDVYGKRFIYTPNGWEQFEGYERWTYTCIFEDSIQLNIAANGVIISDPTEREAWFNNFYEIINGQNVWNYQPRSTNFVAQRTTYFMSVDTGNSQSPEVIDIGGIMWDIIGMPFTFINQAFDVTLFPGTIYQFNIGNLFKGLIAILAVLFVVKLFTRGIDVLGAYTGSAQDNKFKRENQQMKREKHQMEKEKHEKDMNKKE